MYLVHLPLTDSVSSSRFIVLYFLCDTCIFLSWNYILLLNIEELDCAM